MWIILLLIAAAISVPTAHYDNNRTGADTAETVLTPTNVVAGKFGKLGIYSVTGNIYAQPLYVQPTGLPGRSCLIVATLANNIYCFDADNIGSAAIWGPISLGSARTSYPTVGSQSNFFYNQAVGTVSTPVADVANNRLYVVNTNNTPTWVLTSLNLSTGAVINSAVISGQVVGTGYVGHSDTTSGANLLFFPGNELQRAPLTLANGNVYIAFAGWDDQGPWHGWVFSYDAATLAQTALICLSPNGYGAGIWQAGGGPAAGVDTDIYATTGNGTWDGVTEFSQSAVRLSPTLQLLDWFTPANHAATDAVDADLSSGRLMIIPGTTKLTFGSKDFRVWNVESTDMGHLQGTGTAPQVFFTNASGVAGSASGIYGGLFFNNAGYFPNIAGKLYGFSFSAGSYNTTPWTTAGNLRIQGMTGSSNGVSNGIVWITTSASSAYASAVAGTLRALNPADLTEYWNSDANATDALGNISKFSSPTVANGKVYVDNQGGNIAVYGLLPNTAMRGAASMRGSSAIR